MPITKAINSKANLKQLTNADLPLNTSTSDGVPSGVMMPFAGSIAPSGYLMANGSAVSRTTYAALFTAIGTTYGSGDGSTTFNVPNTQGMFLRGAGSQTVGSKTYSATLGAAANDTTAVNGLHDTGHSHTLSAGERSDLSSGGSSGALNDSGTYGTSTNSANLAGDSETKPVNLGVNYIIKT